MIREQSIRLTFNYAAGETGSQFLTTLREHGRIKGSRCPACERVVCPAQSFCTLCGGATKELVDVGPCGTLESWTERAYGSAEAQCFGLIRLDGADTALLHRLIGSGEGWRIGARVRARFLDERSGSILDIAGFERSQEGEED